MRFPAGFVIFLAYLGSPQIVSAHFLWLNENVEGNAVVTFGEEAGKPGTWTFLSMIADKTRVVLHDAAGPQNVSLSANKSFPAGLIHSELVGHIAASPPFSLRLAATWGLFHGGSLLQYWSSADMVTKPNDWFSVQDWAPRKGLEITIRDPWMNHSSLMRFDDDITERLRLMDIGNQCKPHEGPMQDGMACVVAVVRYDGQLLSEDVEVDTFTAEGTKFNTTRSQAGVTILKVPYDSTATFTPVWASVNYHENVSGKYNGKEYKFVDHWATTYARITRAPKQLAAMLV